MIGADWSADTSLACSCGNSLRFGLRIALGFPYSVGMRKLTCQNGHLVFSELDFQIYLVCYKNYCIVTILKCWTRPTIQKIKNINICEKVGLKFAPIGSGAPFHKFQLPKSLPNCVWMFFWTLLSLSNPKSLRYPMLKMYFSSRICSIAQPPPQKKTKIGVYVLFDAVLKDGSIQTPTYSNFPCILLVPLHPSDYPSNTLLRHSMCVIYMVWMIFGPSVGPQLPELALVRLFDDLFHIYHFTSL